ncbi:MAG: hypothetical protein AB2693_34760, partial [Candidatus Thiodiazotropha sp.]
ANVNKIPLYRLPLCYYCHLPCVAKCGHCSAALMYLGQKHNCPDPDEGFYDDDDFDIQLCESCAAQFIEIKPHAFTL